jgi:hypothetical protein
LTNYKDSLGKLVRFVGPGVALERSVLARGHDEWRGERHELN